jgi:hypothetical protein
MRLLVGSKRGRLGSRNALAPLLVLSGLAVGNVTGGKHVEHVFLLVHGAVDEEEGDTSDEGDDGDSAVVPDEMGIGSQRSEGLSKRSRESSGEALDRLDERTHVLGCLGESILERGDGSENLRDGNEHVDTSNGPDGDGGLVVLVVSLVVIGGLVDVVLEDGGPDHGEGTDDETSSDLLDGSETDTTLAEHRVHQRIHDGDNDDDGDGVQVGENVVGDTTQLHGSAHLCQVGVNLAVGQPEDGNPEENTAGGKTTADLVDPGVVKVVPRRSAGSKCGRHNGSPHGAIVPVLVSLDGIDAETAAKSLEKDLESRTHDVTARGLEDVELLAEVKDRDTEDEHDSGDEVGKPETDVSLSVDHGDLTNKGTNVDKPG